MAYVMPFTPKMIADSKVIWSDVHLRSALIPVVACSIRDSPLFFCEERNWYLEFPKGVVGQPVIIFWQHLHSMLPLEYMQVHPAGVMLFRGIVSYALFRALESFRAAHEPVPHDHSYAEVSAFAGVVTNTFVGYRSMVAGIPVGIVESIFDACEGSHSLGWMFKGLHIAFNELILQDYNWLLEALRTLPFDGCLGILQTISSYL